MRDAWRGWSWRPARTASATVETRSGAPEVAKARESLRTLLEGAHVPASVRKALAGEFSDVQAMLDKLEHGHLHIAAFGRVGVGKSALLNALIGEVRFSTSPLHGETAIPASAAWPEWDAGGVFLIDTPGIDDVDGEERERLAHTVARRADLVLFVADGDLSETELWALKQLHQEHRLMLLILNKYDHYSQKERSLLLDSLKQRVVGLIPPDRVVATAANPADRLYVQVNEAGAEVEEWRAVPPDVAELRERLWSILESEGKVLAALNASLFAGKVSDEITGRMLAIKRELADRLIRTYCLVKGVLVGFNPLPLADLMAAGGLDVSLVWHLSRIYGLPLSSADAGRLIATIGAQVTLVMGTVWAVHFVSSALKGGTAGLSTLITGAAQGAVAYYSAYVVGQAAHRYLAQGLSWGPKGPKRVVQEILSGLDRDSLLLEAREQILNRLRSGAGPA